MKILCACVYDDDYELSKNSLVQRNIKSWGPLPVETRVTAPPHFRLGGQQCFWPPPPNFEKFILIVI